MDVRLRARRVCEGKRAETRLHERLNEARAPGADLVVRFPLVRLPEHIVVCLDLRRERQQLGSGTALSGCCAASIAVQARQGWTQASTGAPGL